MATSFPWFDPRFFVTDLAGNVSVASGYLLYQYQALTTTNQATYTDAAGTTPNANPIVLDSDGRCTLFGTEGLSYTFVLKTPAGAVLKTWNNVNPAITPAAGSFLPISGGTLTGPVIAAANATAALGFVTKQQMEAADTATAAAVASAVAAATAAAAAANAAIANIAPFNFFDSSGTGTSTTRTVNLSVGTWKVTLFTGARKGSESGTYSHTVTQSATVGGTTVGTSFVLARTGGSGYGREVYGFDMNTGSLVVSTAGPFTMAMGAISLGGATAGKACWMQIEKQ